MSGSLYSPGCLKRRNPVAVAAVCFSSFSLFLFFIFPGFVGEFGKTWDGRLSVRLVGLEVGCWVLEDCEWVVDFFRSSSYERIWI